MTTLNYIMSQIENMNKNGYNLQSQTLTSGCSAHFVEAAAGADAADDEHNDEDHNCRYGHADNDRLMLIALGQIMKKDIRNTFYQFIYNLITIRFADGFPVKMYIIVFGTIITSGLSQHSDIDSTNGITIYQSSQTNMGIVFGKSLFSKPW